jgi:hypothetical protein
MSNQPVTEHDRKKVLSFAIAIKLCAASRNRYRSTWKKSLGNQVELCCALQICLKDYGLRPDATMAAIIGIKGRISTRFLR